jgi:small GTP-binding protein
MIRKKILLIGDFGVGKTSLIRRYVDNAFDDRYLTTIGVKISRKRIQIDANEYELLIWDIEGSSSMDHIVHAYLKGASGAIFVCDISRKDTVDNLKGYIARFLETNPVPYVVACNKSDLLPPGQPIAQTITSPEEVIWTSAKENTNVDQLFSRIAQKVFR